MKIFYDILLVIAVIVLFLYVANPMMKKEEIISPVAVPIETDSLEFTVTTFDSLMIHPTMFIRGELESSSMEN